MLHVPFLLTASLGCSSETSDGQVYAKTKARKIDIRTGRLIIGYVWAVVQQVSSHHLRAL